MGTYPNGDKSIKISYYFQWKDKELDSGFHRIRTAIFGKRFYTFLCYFYIMFMYMFIYSFTYIFVI